MKITNLDERVHVLDNNTNVWSVVREIADSGVQEEAFYVCNIGEIVQKHKIWKLAMPRVDPHYGKSLTFYKWIKNYKYSLNTLWSNNHSSRDYIFLQRDHLTFSIIFFSESMRQRN